jgi:hypothetical protein
MEPILAEGFTAPETVVYLLLFAGLIVAALLRSKPRRRDRVK